MLYADAFKRLMRERLPFVCFVVICTFALLALLTLIPGFVERPNENFKGPDEVTKIERLYHPPTLLLATGVIDEVDNKPLTDEQREAFSGGLLSAAAWRLPFGADIDGRSVLAMSLHGLRLAFIIGVITTVVSIIIAVPLGAAAGYFGGKVDDGIVWLYTTVASIPQLLLLVALIASMRDKLSGDNALYVVLIVIGITTWVGLARLIRAEFLKHKQRDYVQAARSLGLGNSRIIFKHILPNVSHIIIITFVISFTQAVNLEVFLSFIGIGIPATEPTLGQMIAKAKEELTRDPSVWWPLTSATLVLFVLSLAFSIFGDALRDALDPKLRT